MPPSLIAVFAGHGLSAVAGVLRVGGDVVGLRIGGREADAVFQPVAFPVEVGAQTVSLEVRADDRTFAVEVVGADGEGYRELEPALDGQVGHLHMDRHGRQHVAVAREALNSAKITASNKQKLFDKNIISEYENQLAQNDLASAKAQLAQAEATLVNARKNLSYTVVKAPSAGYVGSIPNREGSLASPSSASPLTTISDISEVYAYVSFNEKQILEMTNSGATSLSSALAALPPVKLQLSDGSMYPETGKVATLTGLIDNTTGSASVRVLFPNKNGMLRSGSTGTILIPVHEENVYTIPQNATTEIQNIRYAYVVGDSNKVVSKQIKVLANNDGKNFFVTSGLNDGDRVVIEGVGISVRDGSVINPVAPSQQAQAPVAAAAEQKK